MGKICYRPNKNKKEQVEEIESVESTSSDEEQVEALVDFEAENNEIEQCDEEEQLGVEDDESFLEDNNAFFTEYEEVTEKETDLEINDYEPRTVPNKTRHEKKKLENVKMIGDLDCAYHIYMEDYVYTYIYQYAFSDLAKESAAILIGEVYLDSKEAIITGMIPIDGTRLTDGSEWINLEVVNEIEEVRKQYFKDQDIIGWLHMQPGYGTMLTMKELREHRGVFEGSGSVFMLVDALNKIESVYVYEEEELKEQSGYCMYYEPNEPMQQYMVEHPFAKKETEEIKDTVVNQFREIGKIRKEEYLQKKNMGFRIMATAIILVALTGIIVRMNDMGVGKNVTPTLSQGFIANTEETNNAANDITNDVDEAATQNKEDYTINENLPVKTNENLEIVDIQDEGKNTQDIQSNVKEEKTQVSNQTNEKKESTKQEEKQETNVEQEYDVYIVKQGDTLANISYDKYGDAKKSLEVAKINGLDSTNNIYVGQELKMPKK